jgi:hypothetical protein
MYGEPGGLDNSGNRHWGDCSKVPGSLTINIPLDKLRTHPLEIAEHVTGLIFAYADMLTGEKEKASDPTLTENIRERWRW